jgi:hypothetical protein
VNKKGSEVFKPFVFEAVFLPVAEIIGTAKFLCDLKEMAEHLQSDPARLEEYILLGQRANKEQYTTRDGTPVTKQALSLLPKGQRITAEQITISINRQEAYITASDTTHGRVYWKPESRLFGSVLTTVPLKTWKSKKKDLIANAVKLYLVERLNELLHGVQPALVLEAKGITDHGLIAPGFNISTPWQGMCFALYRQITGFGNIRKCDREGCQNFFIPERNDRRTCSHNCKLALWRQKKKEKEQGGNSV